MAPASKIADSQPPQKPERHQGEDAHIHPRNHQHVVGAGALEVRAGGRLMKASSPITMASMSAAWSRRPQGVDLVDDAAMDSRAPEFSPAAGKSGKDLDTRGLGRGQCDDSVFGKIALVVERPRIAVVARQGNFGGKPQPLSVAEQANAAPACLLRLAFHAV